jgi:hypothetical protein
MQEDYAGQTVNRSNNVRNFDHVVTHYFIKFSHRFLFPGLATLMPNSKGTHVRTLGLAFPGPLDHDNSFAPTGNFPSATFNFQFPPPSQTWSSETSFVVPHGDPILPPCARSLPLSSGDEVALPAPSDSKGKKRHLEEDVDEGEKCKPRKSLL